MHYFARAACDPAARPLASGKSTIAAELVATRPLALNLDVDLNRGQLGQWQDRPTEAGLSARRLALAMAEVHLSIGHAVVVPQLARADLQHRDRTGWSRSWGDTALEAMYDDFIQLLNTRPNAQRIRIRRGEIHTTVDAIEAAIMVSGARALPQA